MSNHGDITQLGRRAFLRDGTLVMATAIAGSAVCLSAEQTPMLRVGLITDLHYADKAPAGSRHYRETLGKLSEAALHFEKEKPNFVVELGDLIDAADSVAVEQRYLKTINKEFSAVSKERHYVLGNHCVDTLTKQEFLGEVGQKKSYYSFDRGGIHFVVLDSCFRSDGEPYSRKNFKWTDANVPLKELEWLQADLKSTDKKTIVFAHQRLDVSNSHGVRNCEEVRKVLQATDQVLAVFQGHSHKNDHKEIAGIHYCTLVAMVEGSGAESNGYSVMSVTDQGVIQISGFRKQADYRWAK